MIQWMVRYWLEILFGALVALFTFLYRRLANRIKKQDTVSLGVQALLRDRIIQAYNQCSDKGSCTIYELESVEALYIRYRALGGNGTVSQLVERLHELPVSGEDNHGTNPLHT